MLRRPILLLLLAVFAGAASSDPAPQPIPPRSLEELQQRLKEILAANDVPGAGVALFDRDQVLWAGGVGYADLERKLPVTADTLFRIGSITKSFTAVALLQLVEQGKFKLDARLKDVAPELPVTNPWESEDPVTVAEVMEHSAGFDDMHLPKVYNRDEPADIPLLTVLQRSGPELQVRWRPGSRVSYSNTGYLVAGYLVQKFSGEPYEQYVTEHVLRPLGMAHASFTLDPATRMDLAQGYGAGAQPVAPLPIYLRPAGALAASPTELAHLGIMLLNRGAWQRTPLLSAEAVTRMETPATTVTSRHGLDFGYGMGDYATYIGGYEFHGHSGGIGGFISRYAYAPDQGVGFVLLLNSDHPGAAQQQADELLVSYLLRGQPQSLPPPPVAADATTLAEVTGYYRGANPRIQLFAIVDGIFNFAHVTEDGHGGLLLKMPFGTSEHLVAAGTGLWRRPENPAPDAASYMDAAGRAVLDDAPNTGGTYFVKTNILAAWAPVLLVILAVLLMLSTVLFAPFWLTRLLLGKLHGVEQLPLRILPLAAGTAFIVMLASFAGVDPLELGGLNIHTLLYFLVSLLFAVLSLAALVEALRALRRPLNPWLRGYSLATSLAASGLMLYLLSYGLIGLRLWSL